MEIGNYFILAGTAVVIIIVALVAWFTRGKKKNNLNEVPVANTHFLTELPIYKSRYRRYRIVTFITAGLLATLLVVLVVLSGRIINPTTITPKQYNRDIMLCLDVSSSMSSVNKEVVDTYSALLEQFKGERVGMVVWNATSYQQFPFTDDYAYLEDQLSNLQNAFTEIIKNPDALIKHFYGTYGTPDTVDSSLAGDGLAACAMKFDKLDSEEERYRSIVFATDNEVMGQENISLKQAMTLVKERDIQLYTIDPGKGLGFSDELKQETESVNGRYYSLSDKSASTDIVEQINNTQITSFDGEKQKVIFDEPNAALVLLLLVSPFMLFFMARGRH